MRMKNRLTAILIALLLMFQTLFVQGSIVLANEKPKMVELSIVISAESGEIPLPSAEVEIEEGDTVLDALIKGTKEHGIDLEYSGSGESAYVEGISGVYEFDRGPGSGWMYRVNGIFPNRGAGVVLVVPGDKVEWLYTTDLGGDIGAERLESFRNNLDPVLHVEGIENDATVYEKVLIIKVNAESYFGTPLSPTIKLNDIEVSQGGGEEISLELEEGKNEIEVIATDQAGRNAVQTYAIFYEEPEEEHVSEGSTGENDQKGGGLPERVDQAQVAEAIENASNYILQKGVYSEWEAVALAQAGKEIPSEFTDVFFENIENQITGPLENKRVKITDIERLALGAMALGLDPRDINRLNLIELIYNSPERVGGFDTMTFQGNNGLIFALIALDAGGFSVPDDAKWTREKLIAELLRTQNDDGSWALNEAFSVPSVDITGMALIALSTYKDQPAVRAALDRAVEWLSSVQTDSGGFDGGDYVGGITSEAASQVIIGLSAYGIDAAGEKFTKNGKNLIAHLLEFQNEDGGFKHTFAYERSDAMATEQALQALVAYDYFLKGKGNLYRFGKINKTGDDGETSGEAEEKPGKDETPGEAEEPPVNDETPGEAEETLGNDKTYGEDDESSGNDEISGKGDEKNDDGQTPGNENKTSGNGDTNGDKNQNEQDGGKNRNHVVSGVGQKLPDTATNIYNLLLLGIILTTIGAGFFLHSLRNKKNLS